MIQWDSSMDSVNWSELSDMYRLAPLGNKSPDWLRTVFSNSMFKILARENDMLVAAGRAIADGGDCSYICDIAVEKRGQVNFF